MMEIIPEVAPSLSKYAPLIMTMNIPEDKIRAVI
jgi:polyribonucleotide nucleotidyltransferase